MRHSACKQQALAAPAIDYEALTDDELEQHFAAEMQRIMESQPEPATVLLKPQDMYTLIGLIQLASKHPAVHSYPRKVAISLVGTLAGAFGDTSAIAESIRRGWNQYKDES